jgi:EF-hand domain pair
VEHPLIDKKLVSSRSKFVVYFWQGGAIMSNKHKIILGILAVAVLLAAGPIVTTAWARGDNTQPASSPLLLGEQEVKQLILLLDEDRNGRVSKKEFINFMAAEFDRLDTDKSGELDVHELKNSQLRVSHFTSVGK